MVEKLTISTLNVRSLADDKKRECIREWFMKNHKGVMFLQETHSCENTIAKWTREWNSKFYCSHGTTKSRGVAIIIPNNIEHSVENVFSDTFGRVIGIECKFGNEEYILINCYFPTKDKQQEQLATLNSLRDMLLPHADKSIILGGDFNVVLDPLLDKQGGTSASNQSKKIRAELKAFLEAFALSDCLRIKICKNKLFTWSSKHLKVKSRLDYLFTSENILNRLIKCEKKTSILTDHNMVQLVLQHAATKRGPGFWKLNTSLLRDKKYIEMVKESIKTTVNENKQCNDGLLWDFIKMKIRAKTVQYSSNIKRGKDKLEKEIMTEITSLEKQDQTDEVNENIEHMKTELEKIAKLKAEGAAIRARAQWVEEGEKSSSYFLNLEKHKAENKVITQLKRADGTIVSEPADILEEQYNFYFDLYQQRANDPMYLKDADNTFLNTETPILSNLETEKCEGLLSISECLTAVKGMKNNKTPGTDGFPVEFYKFFWKEISVYLNNSINYAFHHGEVSIDQKRGLITLIPKKDKDRIFLKNWRPIALLNTDYKIMAKSLANRIKSVIDTIINSDQTGYLKGRYIGENIRTVSDLIFYLKQKQMDAIILLIDFEKAFDSISWSFLDKALAKFNFGSDFRKWVKVLYANSESAVINNGYFTRFFKLERGVRQGCPLSVYLFILVVELLACEIRNNTLIKGIPLINCELKISQMADDTTIFLKEENSIPVLFDVLKKFAICSGLKTNIEKTKAYNFGKKCKMKSMHDLSWETGSINFLGMTISDDIKVNTEENIMPKVKIMKNLLQIWSMRNLSLKGKITIINSLIISLFVYPATIIETNVEVLELIDSAIFEFLWSHRKPKIAKNVIQNKLENGGMKMPNIFVKIKAWRLSWLKRAVNNRTSKWVLILDTILGTLSFTDLLYTDFIKGNAEVAKLPNFYKEIMGFWVKSIHKNQATNAVDVQNQMLWLNSNITVGNFPILWQSWYEKGIKFIGDILNKHSDFLTAEEINNKYGVKCNFLQMLQIRQAIPLKWRQMLSVATLVIKSEQLEIFIENKYEFTSLEKMTSQLFYWILMGNVVKMPCSIPKWENNLCLQNVNWKNIFLNPFKVCHESQMQSFQFKILHRIISCNHWLHTMKVKDSPNCIFCKENDDIIHYFATCNRVTDFWRSFENWWIKTSGDLGQLDIKTVMFGVFSNKTNANVFNYCLIAAKMFIYAKKLKCERTNIDFYRFLIFLKEKLILKETNAVLNGKLVEFENNFGFLYYNL